MISRLAVLIMLLALLVATVARADPILGVDALAIRAEGFPCGRFLQMFRGVEVVHTVVLWDPRVFGNEMDCLERWAELPGEKILEIHETCGPCERNGAFPGYRARPGRHVDEIRSFCERFGLRCLYSPVLEYRLPMARVRRIFRSARRGWPYEIVSNPVPGTRFGMSDVRELHGKKARCAKPLPGGPRLIADLDGDELRGADLTAWLKGNAHCDFVRIWLERLQGIVGGVALRTSERSYFVSRRDVREVNLLLRRYNNGMGTR